MNEYMSTKESRLRTAAIISTIVEVIILVYLLYFYIDVDTTPEQFDSSTIAYASPTMVQKQPLTSTNIFMLVNNERTDIGLQPLTRNVDLDMAATRKAKHMLEHSYWQHDAPDGTTPWSFILTEGYQHMYAGENLARGYFTSAEAVAAWMESKGHRENILHDDYTETGIAIVTGDLGEGVDSPIIVQLFAAPQATIAAQSQ